MLDGQVDYSKLTAEQLFDVVRNIDAVRYPANFANLKAALEARGYVVTEDGGRAVVARDPTAPPATEAPVLDVAARFSPGRGPLAWIEPVRNDYHLIGTGHVLVGSHYVRVRGRRLQLALGLPVEREFELHKQHITDVEHGSNMVRFVYREPGAKPKALTFWVENAAVAAELAGHLPAERAADFQPLLPVQVEFEERLLQRTPIAWLTTTLVVLNIAVFLVTLFAGANLFKPSGAAYAEWGSNFGPYTTSGEWWRLLTSMFLHFGIVHLLFNAWALAAIGPLIERLLGSARFALLYLVAGVAASLASISWQPLVNSAGASGAIFGLYGTLLAVLLRGRQFMPGAIIMPMRKFTLIFVSYALLLGFFAKGIDNAAHVGGLIAGFMLGLLLARPARTTDSQPVDDASMFAMAAGASMLILVIGLAAAQHRAGSLQGDGRYVQTQRWLARMEHKAMTREDELWEMAKNNELNDDEFADAMDASVLPIWREAERRLANIELEAGSRLASKLEYLRQLATMRRRAYELCVRGARLHDRKILDKCVQELRSGDQWVEAETRRLKGQD